MLTRLGIVGLAAVMATAAPAAQTATRDGPAQPQAQASDSGVRYFLGGWDIIATDPSDGTSAHFTYDVRPLVGTAWVSGRGRSEELGAESSDVWGRDEASGELMRIVFDGSGTYAIVRSPGWQGARLVLEGDARSSSGVVRVRETITRLSDDEFTATWEAYRNGAWSPYSLERVTRRAARS
jgi:hypothetical protein